MSLVWHNNSGKYVENCSEENSVEIKKPCRVNVIAEQEARQVILPLGHSHFVVCLSVRL